MVLKLLMAAAAALAGEMKDSPDLEHCDGIAAAGRAICRTAADCPAKPFLPSRTLKALAASTAARPAHVRILFYGQSIVAQRWDEFVIDELKRRYPTAVIESENRAIGGFTSPALSRTSESDLYPYYPDLLFFHVYGPMDKYEEIIRRVRERTTAEIVLWTSHLDRASSNTREKIGRAAAEQDERSKAIFDIARRYGCMVVDLRRKWSRMMLEKGYTPDDLLADTIHMNKKAPGFPAYARFLYEELPSAVPPAAAFDAQPCGTIEEIAVTDPRVRRGADGSLALAFDGNRVVAVSDGTGVAACRVTLDGREPKTFPDMFYATRPSRLTSWMPMIMHVYRADDALPVEEDWTLTYIEGTKSLGRPVHYRVEGSVTGFDGEGWNTNDFRSASGRAVILSRDFHTWQYDYFVKQRGAAKRDSVPGQKVTWSVKPLFADPYEAQPAGTRTPLVQNCPNGPHRLVVTPQACGDATSRAARPGIASFIVYRPAGARQPDL